MTTDWRKLNGVPVLAAREGRRRKRVKDRPLSEMVSEYLAKGGKITKGPTLYVDWHWKSNGLAEFYDMKWHGPKGFDDGERY